MNKTNKELLESIGIIADEEEVFRNYNYNKEERRKYILNLIEKNNDLINNYFITTHPDVIKTTISKKKLNFMPIPVDRNIETLNIYKNKHRYKDLFFALKIIYQFQPFSKQIFLPFLQYYGRF